MKPDILNSKIPLNKINPANPDYFLPLESVYLGNEADLLVKSNIDGINPADMNNLRIKYLNFYTTLCTEIRTRVDFEDETLNLLQILDPQKISPKIKTVLLVCSEDFQILLAMKRYWI